MTLCHAKVANVMINSLSLSFILENKQLACNVLFRSGDFLVTDCKNLWFSIICLGDRAI